ncbi:MAG: hypothetical protein ACE5GQ_01860, partial [Nitrospinales bacterium]
MKKILLGLVMILFLGTAANGLAAQGSKTGFLVLASDRGFLGNQETRALFDRFEKDYPASLAYVGRAYQGVEKYA